MKYRSRQLLLSPTALQSILALILCCILAGSLSAADPQTKPPVKKAAAPKEILTPEEIKEARERLATMGYWIEPLATLKHESFRHALIAFQKVEGRQRTGVLTRKEIEALRVALTPLPLEAGEFHVEIDLYRQIVMIVDEDGVVIRILPTSTGSGKCFTEGGRTRRAITPIGRFRVIRKIAGMRKSPLGELYYPLYFYDGVAIHGNPAVPTFPNSHGCIRLPMFAAKEFFALIPLETPVLIHDPNPTPQPPPRACPK